jgi:imidazole glycerol-phosphate synthase subunit HisH
MKVAVVNYGFGNIGSVRRALEELKVEVVIAADPGQLAGANRIVLPGVGAFGEAMVRLRDGGWVQPLHQRVADGTPLLGICLGMQLLAASSEENGFSEGLGFIAGRVRRLDELGTSLRIPHVGWNEVAFTGAPALFAHVPQATDFYFVHSFALEADAAAVCATTSYGVPVAAAVQQGRVFGTQFHPEKSSKAGRQILQNFLDVAAC